MNKFIKKVIIIFFFNFFLLNIFSKDFSIKIQVVDKDRHDIGIPSKICLVDLNDNKIPIYETDDYGFFNTAEIKCEKNSKVIIIPNSKLYFETKPYKWPISNNKIFVQKISYYIKLEQKAKEYKLTKNYALAALAYNELFARAIDLNKTNSSEFEENTYKFTAYAFIESGEISNSSRLYTIEDLLYYDPKQGKKVISKEFQIMILNYQKKNNIKESGEIDYKTLEKLSKKRISELIFY